MRTGALIAPLVAICVFTFLAPTVLAQASATSQITIVATTPIPTELWSILSRVTWSR